MGQAKVFWDAEDYAQVESVFRQSASFCLENEVWKMNVAHTFFMMERYKEAIRYYSQIYKKHLGRLTQVPAVALANLCVAYILTDSNDSAEELMGLIEKEEATVKLRSKEKATFHLCIINLVLGTLYCSKGNFDFGISRVIKSLDPLDRNLGGETWFYCKSCLLALADAMAKQVLLPKDSTVEEVYDFLTAVETQGGLTAASINPTKNTSITYEAKLLKQIFRKLQA
eukprot:Platyproteum_vivax@DN2433_c0_g1_i2.p1